MDNQSTSITADQAVFTSVSSPTGEGYRLVSVSGGLRLDERTELTQRSPSHGSLCGNSPSTVGLMSYRLTSGRYCVALSRHAGAEHTARGGLRVYTRLVLMEPAAYQQLDFNPLRLISQIKDMPAETSPGRLEPLKLNVATVTDSILQDSCDIEGVIRLADMMFNRQSVIAVVGHDSFEMVEWTLMALPIAVRKELSVSAGVNYAPARKIQLTFIPKDDVETRRIIRGQRIQWFEMSQPAVKQSSPFDAWFGLIRRWWRQGRYREIRSLSSQIEYPVTVERLARIANLCDEIDLAGAAGAKEAAELEKRYRCVTLENQPERRLIESLQTIIDAKSAQRPVCV